jgi:AcrR family transcriptional regulator
VTQNTKRSARGSGGPTNSSTPASATKSVRTPAPARGGRAAVDNVDAGKPAGDGRASKSSTKAAPKRGNQQSPPRGRDQVIESIIDATLSLWASKGPAELSLRSIAARAGVNYGLVHRHFGTKEAVIRAAMDRVVVRSVQFIEGSEDLVDAMDKVLPPSTGAHARLLAWSVLQYYVDDVLPSEDPFLARLCELAAADVDANQPDADLQAKVKAGSMLATLYGWKLFEPYLVRGLGLEHLSAKELSALVRGSVLKVIEN